MVLVWFIYGLAFFTLGLVILVYPKRGSRFELARYIWMIGVFGLVHGLNEWLDMFIRIGGPIPPELLAQVRMFVLPASFLWLVQFGVTILSRNTKGRRFWRMIPVLLALGWLLILLFGEASIQPLMENIWSRYLLCVPGTFLTAWALRLETRRFQALGLTLIAKNLAIAAATFAVYGVLAGLVVRKAGFFPASVLNYETFTSLTGLPVQIFRATCAVLAAGSIIRVLDIFRWETQEALRVSEQRCATITSALPVFLFMADRDLIVRFVQGQGLDRIGLSPEQMRDRPVSEAFPSCEGLVEDCRRALLGQEFIATAVWNDVSFEICYSSLRDGAGAVTSVVGVALDISARIRAQEELDAYRRKVEKHARDAAVGVLSATVAQQVMEPLTIMNLVLEKAAADLVASGGPEAVGLGLRRSLSQLSQTRDTLKRFMEIAHADSAGVQPVGLYQIARRTMTVFAEDARRCKLVVALKDMDAIPLMAISPREVEQIFYHLIQRVVDAAPGDCEVKLVISCLAEGEHLDLLFSDTCHPVLPGGGASDPILDDFKPGRSSDLGLAIVKNIVLGYGGQVTTEAGPGGTLTLRVRLPVQRVY